MINHPNSMGLGWGQTRDPWMKKFNHLRNEFDFWKVHGIMNTLGLISCKSFLKNLTCISTRLLPFKFETFHLCNVFVDIHF